MLSANSSWTLTAILASLAVAFGATGLALVTLAPGAAPALATALLLASLGGTVGAFGLVGARLRRLELQNEGLIEEISQEFDRVKDRVEIFAEAFEETTTTLQPEVVESDASARRISVN